MTDKQRLLKLLEDWGLPSKDSSHDGGTATSITVGANDKVEGYTDFTVEFNYDYDDNFVHMGIWE